VRTTSWASRPRARASEAPQLALSLGVLPSGPQEVEDLEFRRDALRQKLLDDEVVAEGYRRLPALLDLAREQGAHELLRGPLRAVVDVVEWREDDGDPTKGTATIMLYELPEGFWASVEAQKEERPSELPSNGGSLSRPEWLRELQRLLRDLDHEKQMAVQQARLQPWRR